MKMTAIMSIVFLSAFTAAAAAADKPAPAAEDKPAAAADKPAPAPLPWEKACDPDIKKLCKDVKDDVRPCLAEHEKELSKACTQHFSAAGFRVAQLCEADFGKLCPDAAVKGNLEQCINKNLAKLSPKCRNALTAGSEQQKKAEEKAAARTAAKKEKAAAKKAKDTAKEPGQ